MRRLLAVAGLALLVLVGCGMRPQVNETVPSGTEEPYQEAYARWTRSSNVHQGLELVLEAQVTYRSEEFQQAYLRRYAEIYRVREAELARLLAEAAEQAGKELRFILVAYTGQRQWNDFDRVDSVWRVLLQNERGERLPLTEKRRLENRTELSGFFLLGPWSEAYELVFDLEGAEASGFRAERLTLRLASVLGQAEFCWDAEVAGR